MVFNTTLGGGTGGGLVARDLGGGAVHVLDTPVQLVRTPLVSCSAYTIWPVYPGPYPLAWQLDTMLLVVITGPTTGAGAAGGTHVVDNKV